jgi:hypothetical protein
MQITGARASTKQNAHLQPQTRKNSADRKMTQPDGRKIKGRKIKGQKNGWQKNEAVTQDQERPKPRLLRAIFPPSMRSRHSVRHRSRMSR